ncbi:FAD-binding and (Fe-S)-binding domain-containing protein [Ferrimonas sp. SCSIO 43195]|uniref:D-2-hydroxyglutarate dehydrogenase YdiJ n=1 Tax=Ferrimonas sp. SCSIO 43195 TaxID=2822844 RepID=UPI00207580BF|nr:FAD-binding and (Fe-S)-binding domain-containing protein [Ferrimonas sp. SCSIO 43195]USD38940.1 FAD-binding oxidoreductase [Ferrimonas sp. SCSIO 43195]
MIPALLTAQGLDAHYKNYLEQLFQQGFKGDIDARYGTRLSMAVDNSVYQFLPQAVVFPKDCGDLQLLMTLAQAPAFRQIHFAPRGGGTGTNGQSLNFGVVVDTSRYFDQVRHIDPSGRTAVVESGVVKDALNDALRPHGLFFSPDLSTSNRATLGGMISTDASGAGSLVYGKTSDHVLGITAVLDDGSLLETGPWDAEARAALGGRARQLAEAVLALCQQKQSQIRDTFPELNRFLTGYDLRHVYDADTDVLDLTRLLCGSEGTLAFVVSAKVDLTPIPAQRRLVNISYDSFESALRHAPSLVQAEATAVETIDSTVLGLAKEDVIWHSVGELVPNAFDAAMAGINMVEFAGSADEVDAKVQQLIAALSGKGNGVLGYRLCDQAAEIARVYQMRKKAVGLLGNAKGARKPIAFAEDTAVPPEQLADFIMEFRALLDGHQLRYGMFGHVDAGVLHVRPALDMCDPADEVLLRQVSDEVAALTRKYGGLMWGEHGRGVRSEYGPAVFGELFDDLRRIKGWFDPDNKLNPGKICAPLQSESNLYSIDEIKRGSFDRQIAVEGRAQFDKAISCNGNGLCFDYNRNSPMCPSYKVTGNRVWSPKGRATLMREWLRLLANDGVDTANLKSVPMASLRSRIKATLSRHKQDDFSVEVYEAMQTCLACKACSGGCPVKVDVPSFRAEFLHLYHKRYLRPAKDHLVAGIEGALVWMAKAPRLVNRLTQNPLSAWMAQRLFGYVDTPALSVPPLAQRLPPSLRLDEAELAQLSEQERTNTVVLVQDPFTSYYDAEVVVKAAELLQQLGYRVRVMDFIANGKPQHIKGFMDRFAVTAARGARCLNRVASYGVTLLGVDPALVLTYRDEYDQVLGEARGDFKVWLLNEFLVTQLQRWPERASSGLSFRLMTHCTENSLRPQAVAQWQQVFAHFGARLHNQNSGCCGMAGTFGHEQSNLQISQDLYRLSWQPAIEASSEEVLVSGYSCRSQVKRYQQQRPRHPLEALHQILTG